MNQANADNKHFQRFVNSGDGRPLVGASSLATVRRVFAPFPRGTRINTYMSESEEATMSEEQPKRPRRDVSDPEREKAPGDEVEGF